MCLVHLAGEKIVKIRSNEDVVFLSGGECDTHDLALKRIDRLLISQGVSFFRGSLFAQSFTVKHALWGVVLG